MAKTIYINKFDGGMVSDPRDPRVNVSRTITNFDALTNSYKLSPYHDTESGDASASTDQIQNFCIALSSGGAYRLFGLGVVSGSAKAEIYYKSLTTGGSGDLGDAVWSATANNASGSGSTDFRLFVYYQTAGFILGAKAGATLWTYDPTGGGFNDSFQSLSYTNLAQGLVHSKDDILYIPYDNKIASYNAGTSGWQAASLTLPASLYITSITEYGNYLAIACAPLSGVGNSVVYLWDRNTSLTTLSESIDWGQGQLLILQNLNGALIGISLYQGQSQLEDKVVFKAYSGQDGVPFLILEGSAGLTQLLQAKQRIDERLYFMMTMTINGVIQQGIWSIGKASNSTQWALIHERTPNNDTLPTTPVYRGFYKVNDFLFQSYVDNNVNVMTKTNDQASYTATSIYETTINPGMQEGDRSQFKQLESVGALYEPLPAGAQVVVKYRVDGGNFNDATGLTGGTVFTETTTGQVRTQPVGRGLVAQFTKGTEYEFRIESTGGAKVTGFTYKYEPLPTN